MGSYKSIKYLLKNLPNPKNLEYSHRDFAKYLDTLPFKIIDSNPELIYNIHLRPNMRKIFNSYFKNKKILNKDDSFFEFYNKFNNNRLNLESEWKV